MSTREELILSQVAPTKEELSVGEGCHLDEAICLIHYLNNNITAQEAATAITKPVLQEISPRHELYRLMFLLCESLIGLAADRDKLFDLLFAIQGLPPEADIDWVDLPNLGDTWNHMFKLGRNAKADWLDETLSHDRKTEIRQECEALGTVEAELYLRGLGGVSEVRAYEVINQACSRGPMLDVFINGIHAWLRVAGFKLVTDMKPEDTLTIQRGQWRTEVVDTVSNHWDHWRKTFSKLSEDERYLSVESRRLAVECRDLMQREV